MDIEKIVEKKRLTDALKSDQGSEESIEDPKDKNRKGQNLLNNLEFLSVPKHAKSKKNSRGNSKDHSKNRDILPSDTENPSNLKESPNMSRVHTNSDKTKFEAELKNKWLLVPWIKALSQSYPCLPFGIDNHFMHVNPEDFGSIIAFALMSNAYLDGLVRLNYMNLKRNISKQHHGNAEMGGAIH